MAAKRDPAVSKIVSAVELADLLAVHRQTITKTWVPGGCPYVSKADRGNGSVWQFRVCDVVDWLVSQQAAEAPGTLDWETERTREMSARADLSELKRDRLRGALVATADVAAVVSDEYAKVRARLLQLPASMAMACQHEHDLQALERTIKTRVTEALAELAADGREDWRDSASDDDGGDDE